MVANYFQVMLSIPWPASWSTWFLVVCTVNVILPGSLTLVYIRDQHDRLEVSLSSLKLPLPREEQQRFVLEGSRIGFL